MSMYSASETDVPGTQGSGSTDLSRATHGRFARAMTLVTGRISMNGAPRATARVAKGKRSIGAKVETVIQPRSRRTVSRSRRCACLVWPVRRGFLCRRHEAAIALSTHKTPVCMGMPFISKNRPEPGPDPSEEPKAPHPSVTKPEGHFHFSRPHQPGKRTSGAGTAPVFFIARRNSRSATNIGKVLPTISNFLIISIYYSKTQIGNFLW